MRLSSPNTSTGEPRVPSWGDLSIGEGFLLEASLELHLKIWVGE